MNLAATFVDAARQHREKTAIFWGEREYRYGDLLGRMLHLRNELREAFGVKPGDRVGLWLRNCPEFVPALFGILDAGAVVVPINSFLKANEVAHILSDSGIDVLVTERAMAEGLSQLSEARPNLRFWQIEDFPEGGRLPEATAEALSESGSGRGENDLAVLIYTSGTTGRSKGAMLSHRNLLCNVASCREVLAAVDADRFVVLLPMFHSFMLCVGVFLPMLVGGSIVLIKSLHPPKNIIQELVHRQGTILPAIPQFFRTMAHSPVPENLPLRICVSGGAPLPVEVLREFNKTMPVPLIEGYGLSEASPVVTMNPLAGPWKEGSIGLPIPGVEVSVQDEQGKLLPAGETGEICVRGGNVMLGYWNQPEETARTLRNGWLLTGDLGYCDKDGYFYITDRKKDMLLVNGINVYPREIEELIYQCRGVKEAAVVGIPDPRKGEQAVAFVVPDEAVVLDEKSILQSLRGKLADYKVPRRVLFLDALPRNPTGKVLKTALRDQARQLKQAALSA